MDMITQKEMMRFREAKATFELLAKQIKEKLLRGEPQEQGLFSVTLKTSYVRSVNWKAEFEKECGLAESIRVKNNYKAKPVHKMYVCTESERAVYGKHKNDDR